MSRTLKGTRARGLPPKILLSQRQDATGSFPTVWRTSSDNRTGRYNISFNDNKVVPFNQYEAADYDSFLPLGNAVYIEKVENVGAVETGGTKTVTYPTAFVGSPIVVISELSSANGDSSQNVNVFLSASNTGNFTIKFSSQFTGSLVYRAVYDPSPGTLRVVERAPRYTASYTRLVATASSLTNTNTVDITFNDFGDDTAENFVTFFDNTGNGQSDIWPNITAQTRTSVALTASAIATTVAQFERFHHGLHNRGIIYPVGMNQATILAGLSQENQIEMYGSVSFMSGAVVNQPTKWIVASGSMKKNVADTFVTFTPGQDIQAFRDNANPAVDGKISSSVNGINPFYATGSAVEVTGQGFQQPLWSKSKIEIDITPSSDNTVAQHPTGYDSYPMMYWNKNNSRYEGIGSGKSIYGNYAANSSGLFSCLEEQTYGFGGSQTRWGFLNVTDDYYDILGRPISSFGFPYHAKFQPTSSQQISMSDYISEPFLLEKIVLEVSAAIKVKSESSILLCDSATWAFFLLNSRSTIPSQSIGLQPIYDYQKFDPAATMNITSSLSTHSYLDLIDYFRVAFTGSVVLDSSYYNFKAKNCELTVTPNFGDTYVDRSITYSGQLKIESTVKSNIKYEGPYANYSGVNFYYRQDLNSSGRNQLITSNGREWISTFEDSQILSSKIIEPDFSVYTKVNHKYTKSNPYLILPTDKITLGCQLPYNLSNYESVANYISFSPQGINKITLYGSSLRVNPETNQLEEYHDTLNQLLSSNSIHEEIGD